MILSQGRRIIQRQRISALRQSGKISGASQSVAPIGTISSSSMSTASASSPSLPLALSLENRQGQPRNSALPQFAHRHFSAASEKKEETTNDEEKQEESLKDTVRRMQQEKGKGNADDDGNEQVNDFMRKTSSFWSTAAEEVSQTWGELLRSGERGSINKKIGHPEDTVEGDEEYTGPIEIMVIDESENMTAWERMQKRLTDAPVIQGKEQSCYILCQPMRNTTLVRQRFNFVHPFRFLTFCY